MCFRGKMEFKPQYCLSQQWSPKLKGSACLKVESNIHSFSPTKTHSSKKCFHPLLSLALGPPQQLALTEIAGQSTISSSNKYASPKHGWVLNYAHFHFLRMLNRQKWDQGIKSWRPAWARLRVPWKETTKGSRLVAHSYNPSTRYLYLIILTLSIKGVFYNPLIKNKIFICSYCKHTFYILVDYLTIM